MTADLIRQAHKDLLSTYVEIRKEFPKMSDTALRCFLGKFYHRPIIRCQLREFGDGYTLRSLPLSVDEILGVDKLVLVVMNSPKLDSGSVFDPHAPLPEIPYWKMKGLRSDPKVRFLVWEQDCPVHGEAVRGRSDRKAKGNLKLLLRQFPRLRKLIPAQERACERLLTVCKERLSDQGRKLVILTNEERHCVSGPIRRLKEDAAVEHIPVPDLFGRNRNIMNALEGQVLGCDR